MTQSCVSPASTGTRAAVTPCVTVCILLQGAAAALAMTATIPWGLAADASQAHHVSQHTLNEQQPGYITVSLSDMEQQTHHVRQHQQLELVGSTAAPAIMNDQLKASTSAGGDSYEQQSDMPTDAEHATANHLYTTADSMVKVPWIFKVLGIGVIDMLGLYAALQFVRWFQDSKLPADA
eukprot:jgi/Chrzof1/5892/Cz16g19180.t1